MRRALAAAALLLLPACAGGGTPADSDALRVVVSAPLTSSPWVGRFMERGAELAAAELRSAGTDVELEVLDSAGSPQRAVDHARRAVERDADLLITDGTGAVAVADVSDPAGLPVFVVFEGGESLVDPQQRPTVFRLAPANAPMSRRLADYVSEKATRIGLLADSSSYGREGAEATRQALTRNEVEVVADEALPEGDVAAQVLQARRAGAELLVVWAQAPAVAAVVRAARSAGWDVPVYTGPTGEDPLVRQRLADRPEWLDGVTFVSFRITSEVGPEPFAAYREAYEERFGAEPVGVEAGGRPVVQPPDWSTYAYDAVKLVAAAKAAGGDLVEALNATVITGANGDERGYGPDDREGVSPDDMYFARFEDLRFSPVGDDILSTNLPVVPQ